MNIGFVQNGMLLGLFALTIPIVVHLLFRQRPRPVQIGSVRFLQEIMEKHKNRRRVMRWLLMSLRMLGVGLLACVFARPFLVETTDASSDGKFIAVLIDESASMQLQSDGNRLVDAAVAESRKLLRSGSGATKFEVAFFSHSVNPITLQGDATSANDFLDQMSAPEDSYLATDYAAAFRWAHDVCTNSKAQEKVLHVFTDLQQSGLEWSEVEPMPADVLVEVHDMGRDLPNNLAITDCSPSRMSVRPGESTQVGVSLLNAGPFSLEEIPIVLHLKNGNRTIYERQKVKLESGGIATIYFDLPDLEEGIWQGSVRIETLDDMPFDNQRHLAIMSAPQYRVQIVDGDPNELSNFLGETHFLEAAIRLAPRHASYEECPYHAEVSDELAVEDFGVDVFVLANVGQFDSRTAAQLRTFVEQGGGVIVFGGDQVSKDGYQPLAEAGLMLGEIVAPRESTDLPWRIAEWDVESSVFSPFADPQNGDLRRLAFRGITEMIPSSESVALATFSDGKPFLLEQQVGENGGRVLWVATAADNQWSSWTRSELYVPIVHQMLGHLTGLNAGGPVQELVIDTTDQDKLTEPRPGIYQKGNSWFVVNVSPRESETDRCTIDDFVNRFELAIDDEQVEAPTVRAGITSPLEVAQNELWHWVLFAFVAVLAAEFFVSNRAVA